MLASHILDKQVRTYTCTFACKIRKDFFDGTEYRRIDRHH